MVLIDKLSQDLRCSVISSQCVHSQRFWNSTQLTDHFGDLPEQTRKLDFWLTSVKRHFQAAKLSPPAILINYLWTYSANGIAKKGRSIDVRPMSYAGKLTDNYRAIGWDIAAVHVGASVEIASLKSNGLKSCLVTFTTPLVGALNSSPQQNANCNWVTGPSYTCFWINLEEAKIARAEIQCFVLLRDIRQNHPYSYNFCGCPY